MRKMFLLIIVVVVVDDVSFCQFVFLVVVLLHNR